MTDEDIFSMTYAGALGAFTVCLICGALLADGEGAKQLHRKWHEEVEVKSDDD